MNWVTDVPEADRRAPMRGSFSKVKSADRLAFNSSILNGVGCLLGDRAMTFCRSGRGSMSATCEQLFMPMQVLCHGAFLNTTLASASLFTPFMCVSPVPPQ